MPWVHPRPPAPSVTAIPLPCRSSTAQLAEQGHRADRLESAVMRSRAPRRRNSLGAGAVPWSLRMFAAPEVRQWAPSRSGRNLGQARGGERGKTRTSLRLRAIYDERRPHKDSKTGTGGHTTGSTHRSQCLIAPTKSCPRRQRHERQVTRQGRHIERRQRLPAKNPDSSRIATEALHADLSNFRWRYSELLH